MRSVDNRPRTSPAPAQAANKTANAAGPANGVTAERQAPRETPTLFEATPRRVRGGPHYAPKRDVTEQFKQLYEAADSGKGCLPREAKDHVYLMVDGTLGEYLPFYMDENASHLKDRGLKVAKANVDTEGRIEANAKILRDAVVKLSKDGKKVVLIGHSKGGDEALAAVALYPEIRSKVRAVVSILAPFAGTPLADDICDNKIAMAGTGVFAWMVGGDKKTAYDMTHEARAKFQQQHPYPEEIPTVSVAGSMLDPRSLLASGQSYMLLRHGERSDGLVPQNDAIVPGSDAVILNHLDHASPCMPGIFSPSKYEAGPFTEALVALALQSKPA